MQVSKRSCLGGVCLAALSLALGQTAAANSLLFSTSFESPAAAPNADIALGGIAGINPFNATSFLTVDLGSSDGDQALKIFGPFDGGGSGFSTDAFAATAGDTFVAEIFVSTPSADTPPANGGTTFLQIQFLDALGNPAGTAAGGNQAEGFNFFQASAGPDFNENLDEFKLLGVGTAPAPDNTASAVVTLVRINPDNVGGSQVFDEFSVTLIPEPGSLALMGLGGLALIRRRR